MCTNIQIPTHLPSWGGSGLVQASEEESACIPPLACILPSPSSVGAGEAETPDQVAVLKEEEASRLELSTSSVSSGILEDEPVLSESPHQGSDVSWPLSRSSTATTAPHTLERRETRTLTKNSFWNKKSNRSLRPQKKKTLKNQMLVALAWKNSVLLLKRAEVAPSTLAIDKTTWPEWTNHSIPFL